MIARLAALALMVASPALATEEHWLWGEWCSSDGEIMYADKNGVGFNEHTICGWTDMPGTASPLAITIACRNVYANEDIVVERDHEMLALTVRLVSDTEISILFRDDNNPVAFKQCGQ